MLIFYLKYSNCNRCPLKDWCILQKSAASVASRLNCLVRQLVQSFPLRIITFCPVSTSHNTGAPSPPVIKNLLSLVNATEHPYVPAIVRVCFLLRSVRNTWKFPASIDRFAVAAKYRPFGEKTTRGPQRPEFLVAAAVDTGGAPRVGAPTN